jgi:hypothetical protein
MVHRPRFVALASLGALTAVIWACTETPQKTNTPEQTASNEPKKIEHEKCDASMGRVEMLDTDHDGKPELKQVFEKSTNRELCRVVDLNHDGKPDMYEYYNADGTLRRREGAYETSDAISEVQYFENGKLIKRERDTTGQRKIDTWDTYDPSTGKLIKRERATKGDGKVDQWWTWEGDHITIAVDKNGDGHPDPGETVVVGLNGQPVSSAAATSQNASDAGPTATVPPPPPPPVLMPSSMSLDGGTMPGKKKGTKPK